MTITLKIDYPNHCMNAEILPFDPFLVELHWLKMLRETNTVVAITNTNGCILQIVVLFTYRLSWCIETTEAAREST